MKSSLERQADLLLYKNGFDEKGRKRFNTRFSGSASNAKKKRNLKFEKRINADKVVSDNNPGLYKKRKDSDVSEGELLIAKALIELKIVYEREKPMKGLVNPITGLPLFFDFYLTHYRIAIEFDGIHHYKNENERALKAQKIRDEAKNNYCKQRRIHLLRIPFYKSGRVKHLIVEKINQIIQLKQKK